MAHKNINIKKKKKKLGKCTRKAVRTQGFQIPLPKRGARQQGRQRLALRILFFHSRALFAIETLLHLVSQYYVILIIPTAIIK